MHRQLLPVQLHYINHMYMGILYGIKPIPSHIPIVHLNELDNTDDMHDDVYSCHSEISLKLTYSAQAERW